MDKNKQTMSDDIVSMAEEFAGENEMRDYRTRHDKDIFESGVIYKCEGEYYWWHDGSFHVLVDRGSETYRGMNPRYLPYWSCVCNMGREKYIQENCSPTFKA